ncbi:NAD(P)H-quinone oxidoreductase [Chitinimonas sp. BJYL2]|uniref:NAD(P)H-quinone oxidoreductase n=1 Tax=Chitinimonas sp. BJYL2 TaxID=2976696 RepID=UPI0022B45C69|nr:NAD(P)H-quinone oxidoreductase [Chitinimonas sp. BJYL2]
MKTMRAVCQHAPGGVDTLYLGTLPMPTIEPDELLVHVAAAGVNRADLLQREGRYLAPPGALPGLGLEVSGTVVACGDAVEDFAVGDAVFGLVEGGGYAEYARLHAGCALHKPEAWSHAEAASLPEAWMTAWFNLITLGQLKAGEQVLIHAGASAVGAAAIQLARWQGASVLATTGTPEKAEFCRAMGAQAIIYRQEDFAAVVKQQGGVDVILDCVGGDYLPRNLQCLRPDGRLLVIGLLGGSTGQLDLGRLLVKRLSVRGSTLRPQPLDIKAALSRALADAIVPAILAGRIKITLDQVFAADAVAAAHTRLDANLNQGKVVLLW